MQRTETQDLCDLDQVTQPRVFSDGTPITEDDDRQQL
jgi:hypothetical protein